MTGRRIKGYHQQGLNAGHRDDAPGAARSPTLTHRARGMRSQANGRRGSYSRTRSSRLTRHSPGGKFPIKSVGPGFLGSRAAPAWTLVAAPGFQLPLGEARATATVNHRSRTAWR